jgi:hypothetical protein
LGELLDIGKGVYNLRDITASEEDLRRVDRVSGLDPGQRHVFDMTSAPLEAWKVETVPTLLTMDHSFVTGDAYRAESGAAYTQRAESRRRSINSTYNRALQRMEGERIVGPTVDTFVSYCSTSCEVLGAREGEMMHLKRTLARFSRFRQDQHGIEWLASKVQGRQDATKHLIFFGDGACRAMPGAAATPSKKLIHVLAQYCIVIIVPEWWTSQTCPSCRRRTEDAGDRNRKCTTTPDAEPRCMLPSNAAGERVLNRDVVGGINIGLRAVYHLLNIPLSTRPLGM